MWKLDRLLHFEQVKLCTWYHRIRKLIWSPVNQTFPLYSEWKKPVCPIALHYVPVPLFQFTYLHNALWSHQSRVCWWDEWRHHARIGSLFVYYRCLRPMNRRFHHHLPRHRPKQSYDLCNWHLSKASPFNKRIILTTEAFFLLLFLLNLFKNRRVKRIKHCILTTFFGENSSKV